MNLLNNLHTDTFRDWLAERAPDYRSEVRVVERADRRPVGGNVTFIPVTTVGGVYGSSPSSTSGAQRTAGAIVGAALVGGGAFAAMQARRAQNAANERLATTKRLAGWHVVMRENGVVDGQEQMDAELHTLFQAHIQMENNEAWKKGLYFWIGVGVVVSGGVLIAGALINAPVLMIAGLAGAVAILVFFGCYWAFNSVNEDNARIRARVAPCFNRVAAFFFDGQEAPPSYEAFVSGRA